MKFRMSNFFAIHAQDIDQATEYYTNVFGLKLMEKEKGVNFVAADPFVICVTTGDKKSPATEFIVQDLAEAEQWLLKNDCKIAERYPDGRIRYFEDRYGVLFHLIEKKA